MLKTPIGSFDRCPTAQTSCDGRNKSHFLTPKGGRELLKGADDKRDHPPKPKNAGKAGWRDNVTNDNGRRMADSMGEGSTAGVVECLVAPGHCITQDDRRVS